MDGVDHTKLLKYFAFLFVVFLLIELAVRKVIDVDAIILGCRRPVSAAEA